MLEINLTFFNYLIKLFGHFGSSTIISTHAFEPVVATAAPMNDKIEAIIKLIDIRITENQQLAYLHFPEPEDEYINEYDSRADELAKLKDLILNG